MHGFSENEMPKIERSIDYTFEAYSGVEDGELQSKNDITLSDCNVQNSSLTAEDCSDADSMSNKIIFIIVNRRCLSDCFRCRRQKC